MWILGLASLLWSHCAVAGPWPREAGQLFTATSYEIWEAANQGPASYGSSYAEYGLTPRLSFGGKVGQASLTGTEYTVFAGLSVLRRGPHALSIELMAEQRPLSAHGGLGLAYGRGLQIGARSGWMSIEAMASSPLRDPHDLGQPELRLDATFGVNFDRGPKLMGQMFSTHSRDGQRIRLGASLALPLWARSHVELGFRLPLEMPQEAAAMIGLWQEF